MSLALTRIFFPLRYQRLRNSLQASTWRRWVEVGVSVLILIGVEWGAYRLFIAAFNFLLSQGEIGQLLLDRLFNMGWTAIFMLLIVSNLIAAFSTFYRSREVEFLFTAALSHEEVFRVKLTDNLIFSSWAIVILGLPLILSYGTVKELAGGALFLLSTAGLIPLILIAGGTALLLLVPLVRVSKVVRLRISFVAVLIFITVLVIVYRQFNQADLVVAGEVSNLRYLSRYTANLSRIPFPLLPSYWFTSLFAAFSQGNYRDLAFYGSLLFTSALLVRELLLLVVRSWYYTGWQVLQARSRMITTTRVESSTLLIKSYGLKNKSQALVAKELLQFIRTPQQWIQFLLFLLMIIIYIGNLSRVQHTLQGAGFFWNRLLSILNFGFAGFILASLITRFVYPLVSLEGRNRWILLSSPVSMGQVLKQKFWLSAIFFFILSEMVAVLSGILLDQSMELLLLSSFLLFLMSITLTSLSLGLGAVFPLYNETNPMRIVSGIGGIITILISLAYLGIMLVAMISMLRFLQSGYPGTGFWVFTAGILIFNGIMNYFPLRWGYLSFKRL